MWSTCILSFVCMIIVGIALPMPIPDTEYEQVIAERYLFAQFRNECTGWQVLNNVSNVYQVVSLPQYHSQAADGIWLLAQSIGGTLQMSWMSLSAKNIWPVLPEIDVNSFLVVSHNENTAMTYTAALISLGRLQLILCDRSNAISCKVIKIISFPPILANISKIAAGLFVDDIGTKGWLYIGTDTGLHGLDLSTFLVVPYLNQINVSVSSLAWSSRHKTIFAGTEAKLWIHSYGASNEEWRFEHVTGLIDAPITSLAYNDAQDKLWIGQQTGITLLSPIIMSTGRIVWFFSRLAGQISNPGSDIGHLPFANITSLGVGQSSSSDSRVWLGSMRGVMRFTPDDTDRNAWRTFNSARYMPNRESLVYVSSLAVLSRARNSSTALGSNMVAVTCKGLAVLRFEMWTLVQKAKHFQGFFDQPGRHSLYNLVSGCTMSSWGDSRTCVKGSMDSDGLWTSMYIASQIFRYVATQDETVRTSTWKNFEAMEILNKITGST